MMRTPTLAAIVLMSLVVCAIAQTFETQQHQLHTQVLNLESVLAHFDSDLQERERDAYTSETALQDSLTHLAKVKKHIEEKLEELCPQVRADVDKYDHAAHELRRKVEHAHQMANHDAVGPHRTQHERAHALHSTRLQETEGLWESAHLTKRKCDAIEAKLSHASMRFTALEEDLKTMKLREL